MSLSPLLQLLVAGAGGAAFELVDCLTVGAERLVGVLAPERTVNAGGRVHVAVGFNKHALPAQFLAAIHAGFLLSEAFHGQAFFTASSSARFTAVLARVTL